MAKIFLSYSRKDSKTARKLIDAIIEMGHDPWVDWEDIPPAVDWLEQIFRGIEGSDAFIFLVSPDSVKSEVCGVEVGRAVLNNKRIIPIVVRDVPPADASDIIGKLNWIFMRNRVDDFKAGLARLKDAIELDFEWVAEHSRLQSHALEWHRKKESSLLLRGGELRRIKKQLAETAGKEPEPTPLQQSFVLHSARNERRRNILIVLAGLAITIMAGLSLLALQQRDLANSNADVAKQNANLAEEQRGIAVKNAEIAQQNEQAAVAAKQEAEEQKKIAEERARFALAQKSAARAQIYQTQPGELFTSTLLAINSWQTAPSSEAEDILRKNISLLPIPVMQARREGSINSLEFNAQGDMFATAGADGNACVWNVSDGRMLFCVTSSGSVNDAVFSPDGKLLITGDSTGLVQVIRIVDQSVQAFYNAGAIVWDVDIRRNGDQFAVTRDDGRITLLETQTAIRKYDLQAFGRLKVASFSPNGRYIAAGSSVGNVTLWNLDTGAAVSSGRHRGEVLSLAFSPDSKYLVTGAADSLAVVARTSNGQEAYRLLHEDWVQDIAFNPDSTWFATVSNDRRIRLWDTSDGDERLRMSQESFVKQVKVSENGQWLATTGADRTVRVWNASTGAEMFQIPLRGEGTEIGFSSDGNNLVAGDATGEINVWDISVMPAPQNYVQYDGLIGDVSYSPSGDWFAASDGTRVWLLRPDSLSTLTKRSLSNPTFEVTGDVTNLVFSSDSNWLGISTDAGYVLTYQLANRALRTFTTSGGEHDIAFSSDNTHLLVGQPGWSVDAWDLNTKEQTVAFAGGQEEVMSFAVGPSGIVLGLIDKIMVLDNDGNSIQEIASPGENSFLALSADGLLLASGNSGGLINFWKLENGKFVPSGAVRKETIYSMTFNPSGTRLAVGTANAVYLINPASAEETARILHADKVNGISYSVDGTIMATASLKAVQFWDISKIESIEVNTIIPAACSRLNANFTEAQWSNLFGDEPYRKLCEELP